MSGSHKLLYQGRCETQSPARPYPWASQCPSEAIRGPLPPHRDDAALDETGYLGGWMKGNKSFMVSFLLVIVIVTSVIY